MTRGFLLTALLAATSAFAQTTVSLTSPANNALFALPATIALKASATATAPNTIARVDFFANGTLVGSDTTRAFAFSWVNPAAGSYTLTAVATDAQGVQTTSAARTITVNAANQPPTVNLTAPANNSSYALPATVTLKATATAPEANDTVAKVDFFANGTLIGSDTTRAFTIAWTPAAGSYTLTAVATDGQGAQTTSNARTITVAANQPPTMSLTQPLNNSRYLPPASITLKANATPPEDNDTVARVDFFANGTLIGSDTTKAFTFTWANPASGAYTLTAVATDGQGAQTTSNARTVTVNAANLPPTVSLTSPANKASFPAGTPIALKATASPPEANDTVARVDFFDGSTLVGSATAAPYTASLANAAPGAHTLTAVATDGQGAQTTSNPRTITVTAANQPPTVYYIVPDHLNTPRLVADTRGTTVWRWDQQEPFGTTPPNDNPSGAGAFDFPLRLPGQYYDRETNLTYNYFRDYDPAFGRYVESDPIGLIGGLNTYSYVNSNPIRFSDPKGESFTWLGLAAGGLIMYGGYSLWKSFDNQVQCEKECLVKCHIARCGREDPTDDTNEPRCRNACIPQCILNRGPRKGPTGPQPPDATPDYIR